MSTLVVKRLTRKPEPVYPSGDLILEPPPELPQASGRGWGALLMMLPMLAGSGAMALMYSNSQGGAGPIRLVTGALFGLSSLGMLAVAFGQQASGPNRREMIARRRSYLRHLSQQRTQVHTTIDRQRRAAFYRHPDPQTLWMIPASARLWERRRGDVDFAQVRIALGPQELATPIVPPATRPLEELEPMCALALRRFITTYSVLPDLPIVMALNGFAAVYVRGDVPAGRALARALLAYVAVLHAPDDLMLAVCAAPERRAEWEWVKWLPHALHPKKTDALGHVRLVTSSVVALETLLDDVVAARPRFSPSGTAGQTMPHLVVVLDGADPTGSAHFLNGGGVDGVTLIELGGTPPRVLDPARLVLDVRADRSVESTTYDGTREIGIADALSVVESTFLAQQLAPLRLSAAVDVGQEPLATDLGLADLLRLGDPYAFDPARAWAPRPDRDRLRVPLGLGPDGLTIELDLKESAQDGMGPHGLLIGATGSGKSELLRTLVLGLAATHDSTTLNFVLIDFKGGATFATLDRLPHTSAVITNLADELPLVDRMTDSLNGELIRRQELLRRAGNYASVRDYEKARAGGAPLAPLPSLLIVCDEFSELLSAKPDFIDMFVQIGRVGRSLGIHLLLASQRLEEGRLRGLDTHLSYRIGLRTFSSIESRAVLGVPDAYHLPRSPGHGYLRYGNEPLSRFKAAYVSGVHQRAEGPARLDPTRTAYLHDYTTLSVEAPPDSTVELTSDADGRTLMQILVERLHGRGPAAHQVWLPPLRESSTLDQILPPITNDPQRGLTVGHPGVRDVIGVAVGLIDKPLEQRRDLLWLDLSGAAGHVLVVGSPQSGKSLLLRTLVASFAVTHTPAAVQFYCLDFSGGALAGLRDLPHVGVVATRREASQVRRTIAQLAGVLREREERFARHGIDSMATYRRMRDNFAGGDQRNNAGDDPYGDIFLVVDGWGTIRGEFDDLEATIADLANRGLSFGIHLVASAHRWMEVRPNIRDVFGTRLELRLADPADSMVNRRVAMNVPERAPGRGITTDKLQFLSALPRIDGVASSTDVVDGLAALVKQVDDAWRGARAPAVRLLPELVSYQELQVDSTHRLPIGIAETDLSPVGLDLTADSHFLLFGDAECGKSSFLRALAHRVTERYTPDEARLIIVDYRRGLLGTVTTAHLIGYEASAPATAGMAKEVSEVMRSRLPGPDVTPEQLRTRTWWAGPELYLLVDDYDLVAATTPNPLAPLVEFLSQARDVGLHLVVARRSGGAARALMDPIISRLRELSTPGLIMSGSRDEGALLGQVRPSAQPPGRGWLVTRKDGPRLVQIAYRAPEMEVDPR